MPEFDPDAEVVGLTLTIPTWIGSIKRILDKTDFGKVSAMAKNKLLDVLLDLETVVEEIEIKMEES